MAGHADHRREGKMGKVQEALADYVGDQALWRHAKAQEHPDDLRNERSAESLRELVAAIHELPDDHPLVVVVKDTMDRLVGLDILAPGDSWHYAVSHYGWFSVRQAPSDFLIELAALWQEDEDTEAREAAMIAELEAKEADTPSTPPDALDVLRAIAVDLMFRGADDDEERDERSEWTILANAPSDMPSGIKLNRQTIRFGESLVLAMAESKHDLFFEWLEPVNFRAGSPLNALNRLFSLNTRRKESDEERTRAALALSPTEYSFACAIVDALEARGRSGLLGTSGRGPAED
jgi:hypothetical protein